MSVSAKLKYSETEGYEPEEMQDSIDELHRLIQKEKQTIQRIVQRIDQSLEAIKATSAIINKTGI
ncbi:MAG: hypothetical protein AB1546_11105 [bacterium]